MLRTPALQIHICRHQPASAAIRVTLLAVAASLLAATQPPSPSDPPAVGKVLGIFGSLQASQQKYRHVGFELSESEINQYAVHALRVTPRPGIRSVTIKVFPSNYVSTYTLLDFDAVERWKPGTIPTVLKPVLSGQKSIWLDFRFQSLRGKASFSVEKAYFQHVRLPAFFVQKLIEAVAARQPEHYDASKPLPLPFGLQKIWTSRRSLSGEN